jgi:hypothetical protein
LGSELSIFPWHSGAVPSSGALELKHFLCCGALAFSVAARAHECAAAPKEKTLSGLPPPRAVSLTIAPGREFAADSYVHKPLAPDALIDSRSANWVATLERLVKTQYGAVNIHQYTPPVYIAGLNQPTVRVKNVLLPWQFEPPRETYEPLHRDSPDESRTDVKVRDFLDCRQAQN